jgi:arsenate reductase
MNIQIFGTRKSFDSKKAERWFKERRIKFQFIDLLDKGMSPGEYRSVRARVGYDALVDINCRAYDELDMAYLSPAEAEATLLAYPELFNAPVVRNGKEATVGYRPEIWATWE